MTQKVRNHTLVSQKMSNLLKENFHCLPWKVIGSFLESMSLGYVRISDKYNCLPIFATKDLPFNLIGDIKIMQSYLSESKYEQIWHLTESFCCVGSPGVFINPGTYHVYILFYRPARKWVSVYTIDLWEVRNGKQLFHFLLLQRENSR